MSFYDPSVPVAGFLVTDNLLMLGGSGSRLRDDVALATTRRRQSCERDLCGECIYAIPCCSESRRRTSGQVRLARSHGRTRLRRLDREGTHYKVPPKLT